MTSTLDITTLRADFPILQRTVRDDKPLVYIGFGSITVPDPHSVTEHIYQAVQKSACCRADKQDFGLTRSAVQVTSARSCRAATRTTP